MKPPFATLAMLGVLTAAGLSAMPALADDEKAGIETAAPAAPAGDEAGLADAVVRKVDPATGMVTLKHGALANIGMPAMTMAYKAGDAAMAKQVHAGDKVRVRIENVNGTLTIVKLVKPS